MHFMAFAHCSAIFVRPGVGKSGERGSQNFCERQPRLHRTFASPSHTGSRILVAFEEVRAFPATDAVGTGRMLLARI